MATSPLRLSVEPFAPERLRAALARIPPAAWSQPSTFAATHVHHGYRRVVLADLEPFAEVLAAFAPIKDAWLSCIDPGGFIVPHRDGGPYYDRWQVPISTAGVTEQHDHPATAMDGVPFRVEHWLTHSVRNPSDRPRIHLVIDRDVIVNPSRDAFRVLDQGAAHG